MFFHLFKLITNHLTFVKECLKIKTEVIVILQLYFDEINISYQMQTFEIFNKFKNKRKLFVLSVINCF